VAREGVFLLIDRFVRGVEPRLRTWVFVAKGTEAKEIIETVAKMESGPGPELDALIKSSASLSAVPQIDLKLFIDRLNSKTTAAVAPRLELIRAGEKTDAGDYPAAAGRQEPPSRSCSGCGWPVRRSLRATGWPAG
jgi:hypothetical protein